MQINSKLQDNTMYISLSGELDEYTANYARSSIDELSVDNSFNRLIFDLSDLNFMDSTGVGVLIGRYKKLKNKKVNIFIYNPNSTIEKIFKMSGIYQIMPKIG